MAENSVIISAEEEAKLLKPIDEYVDKIQKKIDALRVDGSDKVNDLKNQIAIAKENKNLSKAQRDKIIENSKKELENAKKVEADNKEEIKKLIAEAKREIENRKKDANANEMYNRVFTEIEKTYKTQKEEPHNVNILQNDQSDKGKKYLTQSLSKYSKREQKLITRIYNIIKMMLPKDMADMVIKKIQEELSK